MFKLSRPSSFTHPIKQLAKKLKHICEKKNILCFLKVMLRITGGEINTSKLSSAQLCEFVHILSLWVLRFVPYCTSAHPEKSSFNPMWTLYFVLVWTLDILPVKMLSVAFFSYQCSLFTTNNFNAQVFWADHIYYCIISSSAKRGV